MSSIEERLLARRTIAESGCWEFGGCRNSFGYGMLAVNRRPRRVHRLMWEVANGPIPDGMYVCHRCDNPPCFNPEHLFLGTPRANMEDKIAKGRHRYGSANAMKTHCPQGHKYDETNTGSTVSGARYCRACARARARRKRLAKVSEAIAEAFR